MLAVVGYAVLQPRNYYTGTNSVGVRSIVATVNSGQSLCVPGITLPAGTGAVQFSYGAAGQAPRLFVTASLGGHVVARGQFASRPPLPPGRVTVPLSPAVAAARTGQVGTVCVAVQAGGPAQFAGFATLPSSQPAPTVGGRPIASDVALWFLPAAGRRLSVVQAWPRIMRRLALFRPGFATPVFYWLLFVVGVPLLGYSAIRLLAVAREPRRHLVLGLALVSVAAAGFWAITTIAFDAPDESEHFAYTESLVETGRAPDPAPSARAAYASDEVFALDAVHHFSFIEIGDTRPPWFPIDEQSWRQRVAEQHPLRSNGGGASIATEVHSPLYYAAVAPGYALGRSGGVFAELFWTRMMSALLGAIVVVAAFGTIKELIPTRTELAVAGALLIAFEPMFSFMAGAVNNDNGVNALAALAAYLTVRAIRRGPSWRLGLALGTVCALLPLMKGTGFALFPAIGLAVLSIGALRRTPGTAAAAAAALGGFAGIGLVWGLLAGPFHRNVLPLPTGTGLGGGQLGGKLTYVWEAFLPRLPFMSPHFQSGEWPFSFIYIHRGFAAFGWYAVFFPSWVYKTIILVLAGVTVMVLVTAFRFRWVIIRRWPEMLFLILVIAGVLIGVELAYYSAAPRPEYLTPEQGRYAFTAAVPIAVVAIAGLLCLSRQRATSLAAAIVAAMICLNVASHLLYITHNFT
jgi:4-amino-4-deoxy-L-arabinose transferase-like glycosyltransferase